MAGHRLTILGLGPGNPQMRTVEADATLRCASRIILRTGIHPGLEELLADPRVQTCDDLYERAPSFEAVYDGVVERVWTALDAGDVVYAVPGHPMAGERVTHHLLRRAAEQGRDVRIVAGVSSLDALATAVRVDLMSEQPQVVDAVALHQFVQRDPFNGWLPDCSPLRPMIVLQVFSREIASSVKLALGRIFPEEHGVVVVSAAGVDGQERVERRKLYELDRAPGDHLTTLWVPPLDELEASRWPLTLQRISARLRAPNGCPWDRKQTHQSLQSAVIEEAYEVADAIDEGDPDDIAEELGDLLLQVALHAQIGDEAGTFSIGDVYDHVSSKLLRRHPHVFGDAIAATPEAVVATWDGVKARERAERGELAETETDPFDRLPRSMPVLTKLKDVLNAAPTTTSSSSAAHRAAVASQLLENVRALVQMGLDPEAELEHAYRSWRSGFERSSAIGVPDDAEAAERELVT